MFPGMLKGGFIVAKNRDKQRENKRKAQKAKEESLSRKNEYGMKDLTPYNAIRVMNGKEIVFR
jgi:3'-phosphoadenosine 5'-phosphosulfate sulfotransferase (PAPS reductase)/FAD synthetase